GAACGFGPWKTYAVTKLPGNPGTISGTSPVCPSIIYTYSVNAASGVTYHWKVYKTTTLECTGCTVSLNNNSIDVTYPADYPSTGGKITLFESNDCGNSATVTKAIARSNTCTGRSSITEQANPRGAA